MKDNFNERVTDLMDQRKKLVKDLKYKLVELDNQVYSAAMKKVPKEVADTFAKYPEYFKQTNRVECSSYKHEFLGYKFVPTKDSSSYASVEGVEDIIGRIYDVNNLLDDL